MQNLFYNQRAIKAISFTEKTSPASRALKAVFTFLLLFIAGSFNSFAQPNTWIQKEDFGGGPRGGAVGFSIGSKGYIGTGLSGYPDYTLFKDFWEYDPTTNAWTQKADFGGTARRLAVGFSIGSKGYIGTGTDNFSNPLKDFWEYDPATNAWIQKEDFGGGPRGGAFGLSIAGKGYIGTGSPGSTSDFWEYDPAANAWTQKADFGGGSGGGAVGFSIAGKGYIGTGVIAGLSKDFWEYDPAANTWTRKADFGGTARNSAVGFSIAGKGYIGTGYDGGSRKDFWEYDPATNTWARKANFGGNARRLAVGFSIGGKGYIGTGDAGPYSKNFWEYTPDGGCPDPYNLRVPKISDTSARLSWAMPDASVQYIRVVYRQVGASEWNAKRKKSVNNSVFVTGLTPNTTYEWKLRNICADEKTGWVKGPNFTTLPSTGFSSNAITANTIKDKGNINAQLIPNPSKGNFSLQLRLPGKTALTTLSIYNNFGEKVWQQEAGRLSGSASITIALENKLSPGLYILMVQHGEERIMQKVLVIK